jgi:ribosomal protein L20A (L18A)
MYKEYREMSRTDAVEAMYQDMAARHRSRFRSIHVSFTKSLIRKLVLTKMQTDSQGC